MFLSHQLCLQGGPPARFVGKCPFNKLPRREQELSECCSAWGRAARAEILGRARFPAFLSRRVRDCRALNHHSNPLVIGMKPGAVEPIGPSISFFYGPIASPYIATEKSVRTNPKR